MQINIEDLTLKIAGGMTDEDIPYVDEQRTKLTKAGLSDCVTIIAQYKRKEKIEFLKTYRFLGSSSLSQRLLGYMLLKPWLQVFQ